MTSRLGLSELLRLGEEATEEAGSDRKAGRNPEDGLPGLRLTADAEVGACGENIPQSVLSRTLYPIEFTRLPPD